jgi:membrane associated rhomboid family serine protease
MTFLPTSADPGFAGRRTQTYTRRVFSLIPISDANPTRRTPVVTIGLIVANVIAFFFIQPDFGSGPEASEYFFENAPLPCQAAEVVGNDSVDCPVGTFQIPQVGEVTIPERGTLSLLGAVLLSTFLHAGFLHIIGNMLFLWVFGNNVEDHLGHIKFLIFYLLGGIVAAFAHILFNLDEVVPAVGASGAVAAVMGAYIVLFPKARVNVLVPIFIIFTVVQLSAMTVLGLWFLYQFLIGLQEATAGGQAVAWLAHVGGFVFGVVGIYLLGGRPQQPRWQPNWRRSY